MHIRIGFLLLAVGLVGCTVNVTPPSGPVDTELCFDPMPRTLYQRGSSGPINCGWWIDFESPGKEVHDYIYDNCVTLPSDFSAGDEVSITITGDTAQDYFKCHWINYFEALPWVPEFKSYGSFQVTE